MSDQLTSLTSTAVANEDKRAMHRRKDDVCLWRKHREMITAQRISESLFHHLTTDQLVVHALRTTLEVVEAQGGSLLLADPDTSEFIFRHSIGICPVERGTAILWDEGIEGEVYRSGLPIVIDDARNDSRHCRTIDSLTGYQTRDMIALPLKRWEGTPIGVLEVFNRREGRLCDEDLELLTIVSAITSTAIEQTRLFQEEKLAEVANVVNDIGHRIRMLVEPIVGCTELLENDLKDWIHLSSAMDPGQARASLELCNGVHDLVRINSDSLIKHAKYIADSAKGLSTEPHCTTCRIAPIVDSVFDYFRWDAQKAGVSLISDGLDDLPSIFADEHRLFEVFHDLLNNAIPETPPGGTVSVCGAIAADNTSFQILVEDTQIPVEDTQILVEDTGRGMRSDVRDTLFTPRFRRLKPISTEPCLISVRDAVEAHGGSVSVSSEVGRGTTFIMKFPFKPEPTDS